MIDKKKLVNELLECVEHATNIETKITALSMCGTLFKDVIDNATKTSCGK